MRQLFSFLFLFATVVVTGQQTVYGVDHKKQKYDQVYPIIELLDGSGERLETVTGSTAFGATAVAVLSTGVSLGLNYLDTHKEPDLTKYSAQRAASALNRLPKRMMIPGIRYKLMGLTDGKEVVLQHMVLLPKPFPIGSVNEGFFTYEVTEVVLDATGAKTNRKNPYIDLVADVEIAYLNDKGEPKTQKSSPITLGYLSATGAVDLAQQRAGTSTTSLLPRTGYLHTVTLNISEKNSYRIPDSRWFGAISDQAATINALIKALGSKGESTAAAAAATPTTK